MKFIDRESELAELESLSALSKKRLFTTLVYGLRRVGKTELVKQAVKGKPHLYFFVYEGKTKESLLKEFEKELKDKGYVDEGVEIKDMDSFIRILFRECDGAHVIFDEVQFMRSIYPAFFSVMQKEIDENQHKRMHVIFLGSIVGLIKEVFEDAKSPLYGRIKSPINLKPLTYRHTSSLLKSLKYDSVEDFVRFHSVFGGFPKYYVAMEDFDLGGKSFDEVMRSLFFRENAPLRNEVLSILRQEFGAGKSYYYHILEAIATGHTKLSEIASYMGRNPTAITPFMDDLVNYYEIIERVSPATESDRKRSVYAIRSPLFRFWFRYVYPNLSYFELGEYDYIMKDFELTSNSFFGRGFEAVCTEVLGEMNRKGALPFVFRKVGREWGKRPGGVFEIDIAAINERTKDILFCECKWKEKVDARKILAELRGKAGYVQWNSGKRKEYYAIFAKSFRERIREPGLLLFDLKDIVR